MSFLTFKGRLLSLLAGEFEVHIPEFKPYTLDYQMVVYASRDFEAWLKAKWDIDDNHAVYEKLEQTIEKEPKDFKAFLNFWVGLWLEKWRERVKFLSSSPKIPPSHLERIRKAKKIWEGMEHRKELRKMVTRKLMNHGEICMVEAIAENLIIEEIARRIRSTADVQEHILVDPLNILNNLSCRIDRLSKEKGPLIYLNVRPYTL